MSCGEHLTHHEGGIEEESLTPGNGSSGGQLARYDARLAPSPLDPYTLQERPAHAYGYGTVPIQTRRTALTYLRHALTHPANLSLFPIATTIALLSGKLWLLPLMFAVEVLVLIVVPKSRAFREAVDERYREAERAAALKAREALLAQMSEVHRQELERLELLVEEIRVNAARHENAVKIVLDEHLGLHRLTTIYIRLAIAYKERSMCLAMASRQALQMNIEGLQEACTALGPDGMDKLVQRRLSIAYRRLEHWDQVRENLEAISHQLATISELIQLLHAQSITPFGSQAMCAEIDRFLGELRESESTLRELAEISDDDPLLSQSHYGSP